MLKRAAELQGHTMTDFVVTAVQDAAHERAAFESDSEALNRYLREQVTQDVRRRVATCFVALAGEQRIAGYCTLASASLGLGGALLADALERAVRSEIAAYALMVNAKDETAARFYLHHGFVALHDTPRTLFLPLATVQR